VRKNLKNSFPEKTQKELKKIERSFYINLCDYAVEMIKLLTISKDDLSERMYFPDCSIIEEYQKKKLSVIILASHQFNWEWLLVSGSINLPLPTDFVYQPVGNSFFNTFASTCRTRFGAYAITRNNVAREIVKRKDLLRSISIVADQYPGLKHDKKYLTKFLNQETVFFQGANQVAWLTQYPVVYAHVQKLERGYYEVSFIKIAEPPYTKDNFSIMEKYIHVVEKIIRDYPAGWLWSHNRWKKRHLTAK
jgi:KDO2-lipid IV(A) lauroyltransferase